MARKATIDAVAKQDYHDTLEQRITRRLANLSTYTKQLQITRALADKLPGTLGNNQRTALDQLIRDAGQEEGLLESLRKINYKHRQS